MIGDLLRRDIVLVVELGAMEEVESADVDLEVVSSTINVLVCEESR